MSELTNRTTDERVNTFAEVLARTNSQVKSDRAQEIAELAELELKRFVEDLDREIKKLERRKKAALDLSPDNTYSIMKVADFDPGEFVDKYSKINLQIREVKIKFENAKQIYNELFGETFEVENII